LFETSSKHLPPLATTSATASVFVNSLNFPLKQNVLFLNEVLMEAVAAVAREAEAEAVAEAAPVSIQAFLWKSVASENVSKQGKHACIE
jgi:hypothetical protein